MSEEASGIQGLDCPVRGGMLRDPMLKTSRWKPLLLMLLAFATACGASEEDGASTSTSTSTEPDGPPDPGSAEASLIVDSAERVTTVGNRTAAIDRDFLVVTATLANKAVSEPLRSDFLLFSIVSEASIVVAASPFSTALDGYCDPDLSVGEGGTATCALLFEMPEGDDAVTLRYDAPITDLKLTAAVPALVPPPCTGTLSAYRAAAQDLETSCDSCIGNLCGDVEVSFECSAHPCIESCTTCECEDACAVPACSDLDEFRACVPPCAAVCGL